MEYSGQKRSNLMLVVIMWLLFSSYILLKAIPHQIPLKQVITVSFYQYSVCYLVFVLSILVIGCVARDRTLLRAYACYSLVVLLMLMCREAEIEQELLGKLRDGAVAFFVLPYWGWVRVIDTNIDEWVAVWCALSGCVAFYASRLLKQDHIG